MTFYFNSSAPDFGLRFRACINALEIKKEVVFLCIGTDKISGDSLGPCTGTLLKRRGFCVYGTLGDTVNATNLISGAARIYREHKDPFIIAIDASLGKKEHIGFITLKKGRLKAGAGVNKDLIPVGDAAITGIVSEYGQNSFDRLVNVPRENVQRMAKLIAAAMV